MPDRIAAALVLAVAAILTASAPTGDLPPPPVSTQPPVTPRTTTLPVERGDTWEAVLSRLGLPRVAAAGIVSQLRPLIAARSLRPGEVVRTSRDPRGEVVEVTYQKNAVDRYVVRREADGWTAVREQEPVETRLERVAGVVEGSLFSTMDQLGEMPVLTARFVEIFESEFDFSADALPGDQFRMLVEKRYAAGRLVGYSSILIAQYTTAGRRPLTGIALDADGGRAHYYDPNGQSLRKMFLRSPLDFTRITSGYSHARRHPILGGMRPHLAVDYAAPIGTPVRAVADGVVMSAGWDGGSGRSVRVRHARGYETMYNHLSKVHVRRGQRVEQRQIIGRVGSTGLSTGPHLDYRVRKNGRFVNPLGERFVPGAALSGAERNRLAERARALLEQLDRAAIDPRS